MLNKAILMGRLVRDPEMRRTQNNTAVASFTLAVNRDRKDPNGQYPTDFIDCIAWGRQAEFVCQWFNKGMLAIVCGRIQSRNWEDKNGNKRTTIEINCDEISFGETKRAREQGSSSYGGGYDNGSQIRSEGREYHPAQPAAAFDLPVAASDFAELVDDDSDVPF